MRCLALLLALLVAGPALAGQGDYLLRLLVDDNGVPPSALQLPNPFAGKVPPGTPKAGLGPVLLRLTQVDPVFRGAYAEFLRFLDDVNAKLAEAGGGPWRMQAIMRGQDSYKRAIEAMGGSPDAMAHKANDVGLTWDLMMARAREFAERALQTSGMELADDERATLVNLLALGEITAVSNRVMHPDYLAEWQGRHPGLPEIPAEPPDGINKLIWNGLRDCVPWMYHAGAMPWRDPATKDPNDYFDTWHFFSHAWMADFNLYRLSYLKELKDTSRAPSPTTRWRIRKAVLNCDFIGFGYESMSVFEKSGFIDCTKTEDLHGGLQKVARFFHLKGVPVVEAMRDLSCNREGCIFGVALNVSAQSLEPSAVAEHQQVVDEYRPGESDQKSAEDEE